MGLLYEIMGIFPDLEDIPDYAKKHNVSDVKILTKITNEETEGINNYYAFAIRNSKYSASYTIYVNGIKIRAKGKSLKNPSYEAKILLRKKNLEKALETAKNLQEKGINVKLNNHTLDEATNYIENTFKECY